MGSEGLTATEGARIEREGTAWRAVALIALIAGIASIILTALFWALVFGDAVESPLMRVGWGWLPLALLGIVAGVIGRRTVLRRQAFIGMSLSVLSIAVSLSIALADLVRMILLSIQNG